MVTAREFEDPSHQDLSDYLGVLLRCMRERNAEESERRGKIGLMFLDPELFQLSANPFLLLAEVIKRAPDLCPEDTSPKKDYLQQAVQDKEKKAVLDAVLKSQVVLSKHEVQIPSGDKEMRSVVRESSAVTIDILRELVAIQADQIRRSQDRSAGGDCDFTSELMELLSAHWGDKVVVEKRNVMTVFDLVNQTRNARVFLELHEKGRTELLYLGNANNHFALGNGDGFFVNNTFISDDYLKGLIEEAGEKGLVIYRAESAHT